MASDPITGLTLDQDRSQDVLDYLGRKSPVALAQQTALPGVQGASPGTAPASPGGTGLPTPGPVQQQQQGTHVGSPFGQNPPRSNAGSIGEAIGPPLISQVGGAGKNVGQNLLIGGGDNPFINPYPYNPASEASFGGPQGEALLADMGIDPTSADFSSGVVADITPGILDEVILGGSGTVGDLLGGAGAIGGAYGLAKLGFGLGLHTQTGPSTGNPWEDAAIGLLGPGLSEGVAGLVGRLTGPSNAWKNFGSHLGQRLGGESSAIQTLIPWLAQAKTRGDVTQAADLFRQLMETGAGVPGYQLGSPLDTGAPQIGVIPGAGGTPHEGGILANFGPATQAINQYLGQLYSSLPEGPASSQLGYGAFAAGMPQAQFDQFMGMASQLIGLPPEQQQQIAASFGLDPAMLQKLLSYAGDPLVNTNTDPDAYAKSLALYGNPQ